MKTQPASLPSPLPSADMALGDEVVFRYRGTDGADAQMNVPLAVGILYAANAARGDEPFALGYPGDRLGRLARREGPTVVLHRDVTETFNRMGAFLEGYAHVLTEQIQGEDPQDPSTPADPPSNDPSDPAIGNNPPAAA